MRGSITIPLIDTYPFNDLQTYSTSSPHIHVKKTVECECEPRTFLKQKIRMLKTLGFQNLIELEKTNEEHGRLDMIYEYVPFRLQSRVGSMSIEEIQRVKDQLRQLAENFVLHCVDHEIRLENVGLDKNNHLKYFLGLTFHIDRAMNKPNTLHKYRRTIDEFFVLGRPLKSKSPNKSSIYENYDTVDQSCKLSLSTDPQDLPSPNIMMKSATVPDSAQGLKIGSRLTFNESNDLIAEMPEERKQYQEERRGQARSVKIEKLGARINRLKEYMREITGKAGTSGMTKLMVKVDQHNFNNNFFQESKIMITPSYTKLEKKIAQFRESKLYRAYNEREILYSSNNKGYQLHMSHDIRHSPIPNHNHPQLNNPEVKYLICGTESTPKAIQKSKRIPAYLLQRKESNFKAIPSPKSIKNSFQLNNEFINNSNNDQQSKSYNLDANPNEKEYRMLAAKDKYCEQFMLFLEGEDRNEVMGRGAPKQLLKARPRDNTTQDRVKVAIRNSIKLINQLKSKDQ